MRKANYATTKLKHVRNDEIREQHVEGTKESGGEVEEEISITGTSLEKI